MLKATTLSVWSRFRPVGAFLAFLGALAFTHSRVHHTASTAALEKGKAQGLTDYHNMCYNNGGFVVIDNKAVLCHKLAEIEAWVLDKQGNLVYNKK